MKWLDRAPVLQGKASYLCGDVVEDLASTAPLGSFGGQRRSHRCRSCGGMRAALSDSLSRELGQNASAPSLFDSLLTGTPTLSNHLFVFDLVLSQAGEFEDDILNWGKWGFAPVGGGSWKLENYECQAELCARPRCLSTHAQRISSQGSVVNEL